MKALVITQTKDAAYALCAGARIKADEIVRICFNNDEITGVADKTICIEIPEDNIVDDAYETLNTVFDQERPSLVLFESTRSLKALAGRLAAHVGTSTITNIIEFAEDGYKNLYFGGVGERIYRPEGEVAVCTAAGNIFSGLEASGSNVYETIAFSVPAKAVKRTGSKKLVVAGTGLLKAEAVVCVGRGFGDEQELELARALADKVSGEMACTRPLTEGVGWMPKGTYLGVSGLTITPKVYFGIGISGQMQHMVGCNRSGIVIAINKDKNAPIFKQADLGIIGDLKTVLPALNAAF
jgi:electron transfer flavoprotein alpha subunit